MFVGWIRKDSFIDDLNILSENLLIDKNLVLNTFNTNSSLCFGVYDKDKLVSFISAYEFENSILINAFYYLQNINDEVKINLLNLLFTNINETNKTILFLSNKNEVDIFIKSGFKKFANFKKATYAGGAVFNFTNATSQSISGDNFIPILKKYDKKVLQEDRYDYISKIIMKQSSLVHSTDFGFLHSYALNKSNIKISPFITEVEVFSDAEKLLRGVIYHRGLKTITAFIPSDVNEIVDLYKKYEFTLDGGYSLLYKNAKPNINLESIYGF